jgi:uncharacterized NAD(P)/FAD-binding protein YdhS
VHSLIKWAGETTIQIEDYQSFVEWLATFIASSQKEQVAKGIWNAEAYITNYLRNQHAVFPTTSVHEILRRMSGTLLAAFPEDYRFGIACQLKQICCLHRLREYQSVTSHRGLWD